MARLQQTLDRLEPEEHLVEPPPEIAAPGTAAQARTTVPLARLQALNDALLTVPEGFTVHPKLERVRAKRREIFAKPDERGDRLGGGRGAGVRVDPRGRHADPAHRRGRRARHVQPPPRGALRRERRPARSSRCRQIAQAKAAFEIRNSPLSENAAVGFEYGYNVQAPERLVIWEAQYGDFINGAQIMLDEFVLSARAKWGQEPSLVMLLPHGHEGQGPDHASARPERFLQLAADINMRVANCTTAAQYFHLLRRQAALLTKTRCRSSCSRPRACCGIRSSRRRRAIWRKADGCR